MERNKDARHERTIVRLTCWLFFFFPLAYYFLLSLEQTPNRPQVFDLGIITVSVALGGLVLNAGLMARGLKRQELIGVAQKFIAVVILMLIFLPALHFVELIGGVNIFSFEPESLVAWVRGFFFWLGAISFYVGISIFIVALVDLVYAMIGLGIEGTSVWTSRRE